MHYPLYRPRRLRNKAVLREMIRETRLSVSSLVAPLFVTTGKSVKKPIQSMPGIFQISVDNLLGEVRKLKDSGIHSVILFGIPEDKDERGSGAYAKDGIVQTAVSEIKENLDEVVVITDVCLCEYTSHGHCGVIQDSEIDNDASIELLAATAVSHVEAGADMVAPSAMMDGQVAAIRSALDRHGYPTTPIMAYSAKYASCFYGPFREAAESCPQFGDRRGYQMDPANGREAMREIALDIAEGADIIMVKPALPYLDIIRRAKDEFNLPLAAYNVSGEFSMVKAAAGLGWIDEDRAILEVLTAIKRAGADLIITYFAQEVARLLNESQ